MNAELSCQQARESLAQGDLQGAIAVTRALLEARPSCAEGWLVLSEIQATRGNFTQALQACDKALNLAEDNARIMLHYCRCALAAGSRGEKVHSVAQRLTQLQLTSPYQFDELGRLFTSLENHELAEAQYVRAIELSADVAGFHYNLATAQRFLGKLEESERSLERVLQLNSRDSDAYLMLSGLRRQTRERNHIEAIQALLGEGQLQPRERVNLHYALAKEFEDLALFGESFAQLQSGAKLRRQHMRYDPQGDLAVMQSLQRRFDRGFFANCGGGFASDEPIFILGMPRTGSTLLERILSSHAQVQSAGELNNFALAMMAAVRSGAGQSGGALSKLQLIEASRQVDFAALGQSYITSTRPLTGAKRHFIDKLPFNYLYIGLIHAALPKARIIHVRRDPMDTCYAIYKQLFESAYPFSYDLQELGHYYVAYRQLMEHWKQMLNEHICEVRYEDLVADPEATARRLVDYCGLEWQPECLNFHNSGDASTTASAAQVRQPVYRSSVGKWKNYREQLQPLAEILQQGGIEVEER